MAEKQNGSWAIHSKERKRPTSTLLFCHKKPAETHQLMALPIYGKFKPNNSLNKRCSLKFQKVNSQFTHLHLVNIPQNVGPNQHWWFFIWWQIFQQRNWEILGIFGNFFLIWCKFD